MTDINWDDPGERARLIDRIGIDGYNRAHQEHMRKSTIETVNGHAIRIVQTRFGRLYAVDGTRAAHRTLEGARKIATEYGSAS